MEERKKASRKKIKEKKQKKEKKEKTKKKRETGPSLIEDSIGNPELDVMLNDDHASHGR